MTQTPQASDLLVWYDRHARALPWRMPPEQSRAGHRQDPYKVWLSEIMLQQTTVAAVLPYFTHFTQRWPTVADLASASDDDVRAAWAGLGYYRRAANLHACAKLIAGQGGVFPQSAAQLKALPGIGDYTSAAIASIAFGEAVPVVDGNVERVITRLFRLDTELPKVKPQVRAKVATMLDAQRPGDFAQAMMDLGATLCTPKNPACGLCPWNKACAARANGDMEHYPVKAPKKAKPHRRGAALVVVRSDGALWCQKRPESGLLPGMTQVPTTQWGTEPPVPFGNAHAVGTIEHVFTHFSLTLEVYRRDSDTPPEESERSENAQGWWSAPGTIAQEAWPSVMVKVIKAAMPELSGLRPARKS